MDDKHGGPARDTTDGTRCACEDTVDRLAFVYINGIQILLRFESDPACVRRPLSDSGFRIQDSGFVSSVQRTVNGLRTQDTVVHGHTTAESECRSRRSNVQTRRTRTRPHRDVDTGQ